MVERGNTAAGVKSHHIDMNAVDVREHLENGGTKIQAIGHHLLKVKV